MKASAKIFSSILALWAVAHPAMLQAGGAGKKGEAQSVVSCSALAEWQDSETREVLNKDHAGFIDVFWRTIDQAHAKNKPQKMRDVLNNIQKAFLEASSQYGRKIQSLGITPQLLFSVDDGCGSSGIREKSFTATELGKGKKISDDKNVRAIMNSGDGFNVEFKFIKNPENYLRIGMFNHLPSGLTADSPISNVLAGRPDPDLFNGPGMWGKLHCESVR